jgi:outer membrane protein assembly factor BamC
MIKIKFIALLISAAALSALSACTYVKTLFPDKEKDYQYTTEIPPLIWPDDLKKDYLPEVTRAAVSAPPPSSNIADATVPATAVNVPSEEAQSVVPAKTVCVLMYLSPKPGA